MIPHSRVAHNRVTNMVDAVGTTTYSYYAGGQLKTEDGPWSSDTVSNVFNSARMRSDLVLQQPSGSWTNRFAYDAGASLEHLRLARRHVPEGFWALDPAAPLATGVAPPTSTSASARERLPLSGESPYNQPMSDGSRLQRLDAILSRYGYCSRSEARAWLKAGRVSRRGVKIPSPSEKVLPVDLLVDGEPIEFPDGILAAFFKPAGYVCTHDRGEGPTIYELLPPRWLKRNPPITSVGRLDKDATGLLLLTDRGELVHRWTSPRREVAKLYEVAVDGRLRAELVPIFAGGGILLEGETKACLPAKLEMVSDREARLELTEGRYHQVKRMFASQGLTVTRLHRTRFGEYELGHLAPGQWRCLPLPDSD